MITDITKISPTPHSPAVTDRSSQIMSQNCSHHPLTSLLATQTLVPITIQTSSTCCSWMNSAVSTAPTITFIPWPSKSTTLPTQGLVIPKIPIQLPNGLLSLKEDSWQIIIDHGQNRDPSHGLTTLLKDWPDKCKQGKYKAIFAQKHFVRSVIAHEFLKT